MRTVVAVCLAVVSLSAGRADAQDLGAVSAFGGVSRARGDATATNAGASLTFNVTPHLQAVGEMGRLGNVLPPVSDAVLSTAGIRASAWYADAGIRVLALPRSSVTPYIEGTAGVAQLNVGSDRLGTIGNSLAAAALSLVGGTGPMGGAGGGLLVDAGPLVFDAGYRYKQLLNPVALGLALGAGQNLRNHQVRVGAGVRF
jgi:hypothetical protein